MLGDEERVGCWVGCDRCDLINLGGLLGSISFIRKDTDWDSEQVTYFTTRIGMSMGQEKVFGRLREGLISDIYPVLPS